MTAVPIVRLAARGDGVTADGRFVLGAAIGDLIEADGSVTRGPDHASPPCRHFPNCGGCQLQHLTDSAYATFVTDRARIDRREEADEFVQLYKGVIARREEFVRLNVLFFALLLGATILIGAAGWPA